MSIVCETLPACRAGLYARPRLLRLGRGITKPPVGAEGWMVPHAGLAPAPPGEGGAHPSAVADRDGGCAV